MTKLKTIVAPNQYQKVCTGCYFNAGISFCSSHHNAEYREVQCYDGENDTHLIFVLEIEGEAK